jgi:outer membrane protein assembly factor BamE
MLRKNNHLIILSVFLLLSAGCRSVPMLPGITAHKIDIQQGNVVTQEMVSKLQPGMTRSQVRFILGTPLLVDPFRSDRWDYIYSMNRKGERIEQRQLKVYFQDDKMLRYEGDTVTDAKVAQEMSRDSQPPTPVAEKPADTRGFFARLFGLGPKPEQATSPVQPATADKPVDKRGFFARLFGLGSKPGQSDTVGNAAPATSTPAK